MSRVPLLSLSRTSMSDFEILPVRRLVRIVEDDERRMCHPSLLLLLPLRVFWRRC